MPRNKYYTKEQTIENLETKGKEWQLENGVEYIGRYHRYIDGKVFTQASYSASRSVQLFPYIEQNTKTTDYEELVGKPSNISPKYFTPLISKKDFATGNINRYFIRVRNSVAAADIIEIDKQQFNLWKQQSGGIDFDYYVAIELPWKLTGPRFDDISTQPKKAGVEDTNRRIVFQKNPELPGIADLLTDYIEYTIYDRSTSAEIKSLFG